MPEVTNATRASAYLTACTRTKLMCVCVSLVVCDLSIVEGVNGCYCVFQWQIIANISKTSTETNASLQHY